MRPRTLPMSLGTVDGILGLGWRALAVDKVRVVSQKILLWTRFAPSWIWFRSSRPYRTSHPSRKVSYFLCSRKPAKFIYFNTGEMCSNLILSPFHYKQRWKGRLISSTSTPRTASCRPPMSPCLMRPIGSSPSRDSRWEAIRRTIKSSW